MHPTQPPAHAHAADIWVSCSAPNKKSIVLSPLLFYLAPAHPVQPPQAPVQDPEQFALQPQLGEIVPELLLSNKKSIYSPPFANLSDVQDEMFSHFTRANLRFY